MEWTDVLKRIAEGESGRPEFKSELGNLRAIGIAICAFANTEGGVIIVGVDDSREIVGVEEDTERVQERLTSFLQTGCSSPVNASVGSHEDPKGRIHWIEVPRQRGFEPLRYGGRVWVRRQRSSVEPSPTELQELYNAFGYILTEERPIQAATTTRVDLEAFRAYLRRLGLDTEYEPQPNDEDDLRNRGVVAELGRCPASHALRRSGVWQGAATLPANTQLPRGVRLIPGRRPRFECPPSSGYCRTFRRASTTSPRLVLWPRTVRIVPRIDPRRSPAAATAGASRSAGQLGRASGLCRHRIEGAARVLRNPCGRNQPGRLAQPHAR